MFTGNLTRQEMEHEHPLELTAIDAGTNGSKMHPAIVKQRQRIFVPVATILSVVLLVGLYIFVTFEQTAITTVPRQTRDVFVQATATPEP